MLCGTPETTSPRDWPFLLSFGRLRGAGIAAASTKDRRLQGGAANLVHSATGNFAGLPSTEGGVSLQTHCFQKVGWAERCGGIRCAKSETVLGLKT